MVRSVERGSGGVAAGIRESVERGGWSVEKTGRCRDGEGANPHLKGEMWGTRSGAEAVALTREAHLSDDAAVAKMGHPECGRSAEVG